MLHKSLCLTHDCCCWDVGGGGITLSLSSRSRQTGRTWGRDEISLKRQITNQFVSLSIVQGEDPLRQDWRKSGSGEAVMWCWPGHPVKVKNLDSGGFSFKPSVYFHATNQSPASLLCFLQFIWRGNHVMCSTSPHPSQPQLLSSLFPRLVATELSR